MFYKLESERTARETERIKAVQVTKYLKAAMATISKQDRELNTTWTALAAAQAQALADIVAARMNAEVEVAVVRAEAEEAAAAARD